jgi:ribonuclease HI
MKTEHDTWTAWGDGTCVGNLGPAGIGGILRDTTGAVVAHFSKGVGLTTVHDAKASATEEMAGTVERKVVSWSK